MPRSESSASIVTLTNLLEDREWIVPIGSIGLWLFASLILFFAVPPIHADDTVSLTEEFQLNFNGLPLKYERIFNYEDRYPKGPGFYVGTVHDVGPAVQAGLRRGNIITKIQGQTIRSLDEIRNIVINNFDRQLTFTVYRMDPRYEKRIRENPYFRPDRNNVYNSDTFTVVFPKPQEENNPVVAGESREIYHKFHYNHSPDTMGNPVYQNPEYAKLAGLNPCPVCFPGGTNSLENMVTKRFLGTQKFVQKITKGNPEVKPVPERAQKILQKLSEFRLRKSLKPQVSLYQSDKMYAFGLRSGEAILSNNLYVYASQEPKQAMLLGHLLAHSDREHEHSPVEERQLRSLIERAIQRTTGVGFTFEQLREWSPAIPGFGYYSEIMEQGYGDQNEREAIFLAMVYTYQAGYDLSAMDRWLDARRDMIYNVHENWLDFLLIHPLPTNISRDVNYWQEHIPEQFERQADDAG
jgi:hypothetical protein